VRFHFFDKVTYKHTTNSTQLIYNGPLYPFKGSVLSQIRSYCIEDEILHDAGVSDVKENDSRVKVSIVIDMFSFIFHLTCFNCFDLEHTSDD
jgi:hypothetical protein